MAETRADEVQTPRVLDTISDEQIYLSLKDPWAAKPLDLAGTLRLFQIAGDLVVNLGTSPEETKISALFGKIDKNALLTLLELITQQPSEWLENNYNFRKAVRAVLDFWKINELGALLGELGWEGLAALGGGTAPAEAENNPIPNGSAS